jgi:hypothetical protein
MIVWGAGFNTGGRYDPVTDSWTATSTVDAPAARSNHAAIWTGSRMIVWGGFSGATYFNGGARYDPGTDSWSAMTVVDAPVGRRYHTAAWTGSVMVIWGGLASGGGVLGSGGRYDPTNDVWTPTSSIGAPVARSQHTAVGTGSEVIVWGGAAGATHLNTGGRYDAVTDTWLPTSLANVPPGRTLHTATWTGSFMIVWGGFGSSNYLGTGSRYAIGQSTDGDGDGYSECDGDCNDASSAVHPGGSEACDGLDNDCNGSIDDGIVAPVGAPALGVAKSLADAVISWTPLDGATRYDAVEGDLVPLTAGSGDYQSSVLACLLDDGAATSVSSATAPGPGGGLWFLVRGVNCAGPGTYDEGTGSQQGSRDSEIAASANACP